MSQLSEHVFSQFLKPCLAVFGEPPTEDANLFLAEYDRQLRGFSAEALSSAKDTVVRNHKGPQRWPKPAVCVDAATDAQEIIGQKAKASADAKKLPFSVALQRAEARMDCELGRRAAHEGWCLGLKEFIATHDRFPNTHEQGDIIETSRFVDHCAAGAIHMGHLHTGLLRLATLIVRRRESLAQRLVGPPEPGQLSTVSRRMTGERE